MSSPPPIPDSGRLRLAVVGMHRSGTSYLAGSLEAAGLHLGDVSRWNPHNQRGNREHDAVVALNDDVLGSNGGAWDSPPAAVRWSAEHLARGRQITAAHDHQVTWGFKDPRTLLTLSGWRVLLPDLTYAGTFRHPDAVTASLQARATYGGTTMSRAACLDLWLAYNDRLLELHREHPFPVICYDWDDQRLEAATDSIARHFGLSPAGGSFLAPELRHEAGADLSGLPPRVAQTYARLAALAEEWPA